MQRLETNDGQQDDYVGTCSWYDDDDERRRRRPFLFIVFTLCVCPYDEIGSNTAI